ncbi:hypothetical protein BGW38_008787 [Lunasporangiospora selenospora]|uniref:Tetratricopeptide repeat-containing protein n=1 Tax=Lunasporangiospora selenospora TaxID=979761 RepID=A0A9P6K9C7_9FUNG|nr:hypothetical protein BGW38_008787 [Lunasporangiospora selenospora]
MLKSVASFAHLSRRAIALHPTRVHRTLSAISSSQTIASRASTVLLRREYASFGHQTASNSRKKFPLSAVALILGGLTLTSLGLWQFYTSNVNNFPEPIRSDLRKALYFQNYGDDPVKAEQFYRRAMEAALEHPDLKRDGPEVTGILIQFGTMLEDLGKKQDAVDVLTVAFEALVHGPVVREEPAEDHSTTHKRMIKMLNEPPATQTSSTTWDASQDSQLTSDTEGAPETETHHGPRTMDGKTLIKTIGIAQKLGDLLHQLKKDQQAERYYLWSVEQLLRSYHQSHNAEETRLLEARDRESLRREFNFDKLPSWMSKTDLGASLEALGGFYASKGRYSHAIPLYGKALSLTESKSCHSAVLM